MLVRTRGRRTFPGRQGLGLRPGMYGRQRCECGVLCGAICRGSAAEGGGLIECEDLAQKIIRVSGEQGYCNSLRPLTPLSTSMTSSMKSFPLRTEFAGINSMRA